MCVCVCVCVCACVYKPVSGGGVRLLHGNDASSSHMERYGRERCIQSHITMGNHFPSLRGEEEGGRVREGVKREGRVR